MDPYLPDKADELFKHLLPKYRKNRERWPLWTYNREPEPPGEEALQELPAQRWISMWTPSEAWADRLQWSPTSHLRPLTARAWLFLEEELGVGVSQWSPGDGWATVEETATPDTEPRPNGRIRIPYLFALESVAIVLQLAPDISDFASASVEIPDPDRRAGLDPYDYRELADTLIRTLVSADTRLPESDSSGSSTSDPIGVDVDVGGPTDLAPFLDRMVWQHTSSRDEESPEDLVEDDLHFDLPEPEVEGRGSLARGYCESAGLLPSRQGAANVLIHDYRFLKLWSETESLVEFLRDWTPDEELLHLLRRLLRQDEHLTDLEVSKLVQWGEAGLTTPHMIANHRLALPVVRLRFPFLRVRELREVLEREEIGGTWGLQDRQPCRRLLARRFPNWRPTSGDDPVREYLSRVKKRTDLDL